jgi:Na+:H+ antiporter, NhaC family
MTESEAKSAPARPIREPSLLDAIIPLVLLAVLIGGAVALFGLDATAGPIQAALIVCSMVAALIAMKNGHAWEAVQAVAQRGMTSIVSAIFILLAVGALIGTWNLSGTIPTLVYYGIQVLEPSWYYVATLLICAAIASVIGSSWTTAGTIGVGLIGIGVMLGVSPAITAGAVISGAYFGDKTSPLSETTILSAQLVGADLYKHIRSQLWTSGPAMLVSIVLLWLLGFGYGPEVVDGVSTEVELGKLDQIFNITAWNLLPLLLLGVLSVRKAPASMALIAAALMAGVMAVFLQPQVMKDFVNEPNLAPALVAVKGIWTAMATGFQIKSGVEEIDSLLSRGGMDSMLMTLWIIIGAVTFGTLLDEFGLIRRLINPMLYAAKSTGRLFATVLGTGFGLNLVAGDQYIALVLPARIYRAEFAKRGLASTNLSRLAADGGTVTSPLIPWNSCGAYMSAALGVSTLLYAPFAFFCIFSPVFSLLLGITGFKVLKVAPVVDEPAGEAAR